MSRGPSAAGLSEARGGCREQNVLNDVMPELVNRSGQLVMRDLPGAAIDFTNLQNLMAQQNSAMTNGSSVSGTIKEAIIRQILTDEVRGDAREILGPMFAIPEDLNPVANRNAIIDSILDSMIQDLSVFRSIQMTGTLLLKAFYKNNGFRVAIAASFVGSTFYVTWISGLGSLCTLGIDGCQIVLSALAACYNLIANPHEFMVQFNLLLGEPISGQIANFITVLRENIATPALFAGLVAQGNVTLLERLYRQPAVPAPDAEGGPPPAQAQEPGHLENLRDAIDREIVRLRAEQGAPGDTLTALIEARESINRAIAPDPAADAAAAAPAAAAAAAANVSLFNVMLGELRSAGGEISRYVKRYVLNLYNYLNRVRQIFPGVVGPTGTDFLSYSCNVIQNRITRLFGSISEQFTHANINERQILLATLFEFMLPSNLRKSIFRDDEFSASKELGILAFRLKPRIIHCLSGKLRLTEQDALRLLDSCILFASTMTEDNVAQFVSLMPHVILERILLTEPQGSQSDSMGSMTVNPSDSPLPERLFSVQRDMLEAIRKNPELFVLGKEFEEFQKVYGAGFKGAVVKLLNAQPTVVLSDVAQTAKCCVMHNVVSSEIALFERPAEPSHLSAAHRKFLPLENLFSGMCRRLFIYTTDVVEKLESSNEEVTDEEIRQRVYTALKSQLGYNDDEEGQQKAETFVRGALLGFKLGCLWNPMRCTFTPALGFKDGRPLAIMMLDIEATDVEVNPISRLLQGRFKVPCSFLESGGIPVPQKVVGVASSARDMAVSAAKTFGGGLNFVMRGVVSFGRNWLPCSAPAARVEAAASRSVKQIGEEARQLSNELELGVIDVELSKGPGEAVMAGEKTQEQRLRVVELTAEQEGRLSALLDRSQPVISESLSMLASAVSEEQRSRRRGRRRGHSRGHRHSPSSSPSSSSSRSSSPSSSPSRKRSPRPRPSPSRKHNRRSHSRSGSGSPRDSSSSERGHGGGLGRVRDSENKGGSRTRRRLRRSSTGSSTTRGRKATSRRNQSKKHKQSSRRRRSSRKSSRKN
jgi:hypothetical protein